MLQAQLVLVFWEPTLIQDILIYSKLQKIYPKADIIFSSTAGEILSGEVYDASVSVTAIFFESTVVQVVEEEVHDMSESFQKGELWMKTLKEKESLKHVLVFSDWLWVNGSKLLQWMHQEIGEQVGISWGLAADGPRFKETFVSLNDTPNSTKKIVFVWLYGTNLEVWTWSF